MTDHERAFFDQVIAADRCSSGGSAGVALSGRCCGLLSRSLAPAPPLRLLRGFELNALCPIFEYRFLRRQGPIYAIRSVHGALLREALRESEDGPPPVFFVGSFRIKASPSFFMPGRDVDLVVIGAGLSGCAFVAALRSKGWGGTIQIVEAGRGPGGRSATRRRRDDPLWRLDHGTPTLSFQAEPRGRLRELMTSLERRGVVREDHDPVVGLNHLGALVAPPEHPLLRGPRWRGIPTMATVLETLLSDGANSVDVCFGERIQTLSRVDERWVFPGGLRAGGLVLSGTLLAHPRSLAMLGWRDVPLREAVPEGHDAVLDQALAWIAGLNASIRWNLMLEFPGMDPDPLPRQIWLTPRAQQQFGVERIVLQRQQQGRLGLVMHGLDDGALITPETQPQLLIVQEQRLLSVLPELLRPWPSLQRMLSSARSLGVMRWGAAQPLGEGMPKALQWCQQARVGFCGDWIAGSGFGMAEGAIQSGLDLADLIAF